jgi:Domain of unknown function DUF29
LGRNDRRAITHQLERLVTHLLKWAYQPQQRPQYGRSWNHSLYQARAAIDDLIEESPSLQDYPAPPMTLAYRRVLRRAAADIGLPLATFPAVCSIALAVLVAM